jgi:GH24 family phage-related lysozyme (muramidase)
MQKSGKKDSPDAQRKVVSPAGLRFIAGWEGFSSHLYNDALGHCTIGYGHLVHLRRCNGSEPDRFKRGITQKHGLELLREDSTRYSAAVNTAVHVPLNQPQFDALVSLTYNVGIGAFLSSTLLRKLNNRDYPSVPGELMRWTNGGLPGLVRRRKAEGILFRDGKYSTLAEKDRATHDEPEHVEEAPPAESGLPNRREP